MTNTKAWNTWICQIPLFALQKSPHSWFLLLSVNTILPSTKHLFWWWHVWLCISDSHCTSIADLRLITVCINTENTCHHVLVSQNLARFQLPSLFCPKKVEIVFLLFVKLCLSTAFSFCLFSFWKRNSCEVTKPAEKLEVFDISPGTHYTASVATFFISSIFFFNLFPLFFFISPLEHIVLRQWALKLKLKQISFMLYHSFLQISVSYFPTFESADCTIVALSVGRLVSPLIFLLLFIK